MRPDQQRARIAARELLETCGIKRVPTPLNRIAKKISVRIEYAPLDGDLSGMAAIKDDRKIVWVNALHHPNRQRFTLAHELGHHVLHESTLRTGVHVDKGVLRRDTLSSEGTEKLEIEANAFASELLMPITAFDNLPKSAIDLEDDQKVEKLAEFFKVSTAAIQYRIMSL